MIAINEHSIAGQPEPIAILAIDDPGPGGAHHQYNLDLRLIPAYPVPVVSYSRAHQRITFQTGALKEVGPNGVSNEALLAIVAHRLQCFQSGPFKNNHNAVALSLILEALEVLHTRTRERIARGVEGKAVV